MVRKRRPFAVGTRLTQVRAGGRTGDSGALQGGRTFESFPSTRTSSMAVPSIPEGMERLSSGPTPDHMPSPFSNPDLQTDALAEETKPGSGAMDPQAPADNGFGQGKENCDCNRLFLPGGGRRGGDGCGRFLAGGVLQKHACRHVLCLVRKRKEG